MKIKLLLFIFMVAYIVYFSYFSILRYRTLYASYFDLGIMHQTVYNTYKAIVTQDFSRFLELTNPYGSEQIKRIAIHNDPILALVAPFYFIHSGPSTLLIVQTVVLALGAIPIFLLAKFEFRKFKYGEVISLIFSLAYLLYTPMERANIFDFHGVTLVTTFLLFMFYFWFTEKFRLSFLFLVLSLLTKEQIGLTTAFFGMYTLYSAFTLEKSKKLKKYYFGVAVILVSLVWFAVSVSYLIPHFRGRAHFALEYYRDYGDSPIRIIMGLLKHPYNIVRTLFNFDTLKYIVFLTGPLGFIALLSPSIFMAMPEFAINLLSSNDNMQNIIYHYTSVITPFIFIAGIFGAKKLSERLKKKVGGHLVLILGGTIMIFTLMFAYLKGPLPFTRGQEIHPFIYPQKEVKDVILWSNALVSDKIKISTTGQLSPFFTSRRYFYTFSSYYPLADYVIIRPNEIADYPERAELVPVYEKLKKDQRFDLIYKRNNFEVYKKIEEKVE